MSLGRLPRQSGLGGEEKNSHPLPVLEHPIIQLVAQCYTTELYRLLPRKSNISLILSVVKLENLGFRYLRKKIQEKYLDLRVSDAGALLAMRF
jgi:hypothetical protein